MPSGRSRDIPEPVRENPLEEELSFDLNDILMEDLYELGEDFSLDESELPSMDRHPETPRPAPEEEPRRGRKARPEPEEEPRRGRKTRPEPEEEPRRGRKARPEPEEEAPRRSRKAPGGGKRRPAAPDEEGTGKSGRKARLRVALIAGLSVAAVLVVGLLALSLAVRGVDTIYNGIAVNGVELGGMTQEEANQALLEEGHRVYDNLVVTVSLPLNNLMTITAQEAGVQISAAQAAQAAWNYGRDGGLLKNLFRYIGCRFLDNNTFAYEPWLDVTMDEAAIRALVAEKSKAIDEALLTSGTDIREEEIRVVKGAKALPIDEEEVFQLIRQAFLTGDAAAQIYEAPVEVDESFDFQALYDQVYAEVKDAELDEETGEVIPSVTGVTFDIAAAEKKWAEAEYGEEVIIPLILDEPEVSTEDLSGLLFRDVLSMDYTMAYLKGEEVKDEVRTSLAGSTANRISNVELACASINGIILQPGDEFSFNDALGERTAENGYLPATAYANGEVRQEYGGGICQVSSTLYNAALYANLEITQRECHQFQVGYLPWGLDATVSWGWPDFKFKNDKEYPIKIVAWVDKETNECVIQILGTNTDHTFVVMHFANWEYFDEEGLYFDASGNPLSIGMKAVTWRYIYNEGDDFMDSSVQPLSSEVEVYSTYNYHQEDIEARNVPTPAPETPVPETPVPSTPVPSTPVPSTPVPSTPVPDTPVPDTPVPDTPAT